MAPPSSSTAGTTTVDPIRQPDQAFIDELDSSRRGSDHISADQRSVSVSLKGPSLISPLSPVEAEAVTEAGCPQFFYYEKDRLTIDLEFPEDPEVLEPVSVDVVQNTTRHVSTICDLLDETVR